MTTQAEDLAKALDAHAAATLAASIHVHTGLSQIAEALGGRNAAERRQDGPGTPRMPGRVHAAAEPLRDAQDATQRHRKPLAENDWPDTAPPDLTDPEPTQPEWATATVVQDNEQDMWGRHFGEYTLLGDIAGAGTTVLKAEELEEELGPLTVILDANGNPPALAKDDVLATAANPAAVRDLINRAETAEHRLQQLLDNTPEPESEWLDADALDELPAGVLVESRDGTSPPTNSSEYRHLRGFSKGNSGDWFKGGFTSPRYTAAAIAPARVLWTPEAGR